LTAEDHQDVDIQRRLRPARSRTCWTAPRSRSTVVEAKPPKRNPSPPFTTSTLQQAASSKLGFNASRTMQVAQKLYEGIDIGGETVGLITYMRTDGVQMAPEAITEARDAIGTRFGERYVPDQARLYSTKAKNAQEAHEAIRPTGFSVRRIDRRSISMPTS
jgi:DNA topoisomerase-1